MDLWLPKHFIIQFILKQLELSCMILEENVGMKWAILMDILANVSCQNFEI